MPIYTHKCTDCNREQDFYLSIKDREKYQTCCCGGETIHIFSTSFHNSHSLYPFVDTVMDHKPIEIKSLAHRRALLKERGLQECGVRRGMKGQWV